MSISHLSLPRDFANSTQAAKKTDISYSPALAGQCRTRRFYAYRLTVSMLFLMSLGIFCLWAGQLRAASESAEQGTLLAQGSSFGTSNGQIFNSGQPGQNNPQGMGQGPGQGMGQSMDQNNGQAQQLPPGVLSDGIPTDISTTETFIGQDEVGNQVMRARTFPQVDDYSNSNTNVIVNPEIYMPWGQQPGPWPNPGPNPGPWPNPGPNPRPPGWDQNRPWPPQPVPPGGIFPPDNRPPQGNWPPQGNRPPQGNWQPPQPPMPPGGWTPPPPPNNGPPQGNWQGQNPNNRPPQGNWQQPQPPMPPGAWTPPPNNRPPQGNWPPQGNRPPQGNWQPPQPPMPPGGWPPPPPPNNRPPQGNWQGPPHGRPPHGNWQGPPSNRPPGGWPGWNSWGGWHGSRQPGMQSPALPPSSQGELRGRYAPNLPPASQGELPGFNPRTNSRPWEGRPHQRPPGHGPGRPSPRSDNSGYLMPGAAFAVVAPAGLGVMPGATGHRGGPVENRGSDGAVESGEPGKREGLSQPFQQLQPSVELELAQLAQAGQLAYWQDRDSRWNSFAAVSSSGLLAQNQAPYSDAVQTQPPAGSAPHGGSTAAGAQRPTADMPITNKGAVPPPSKSSESKLEKTREKPPLEKFKAPERVSHEADDQPPPIPEEQPAPKQTFSPDKRLPKLKLRPYIKVPETAPLKVDNDVRTLREGKKPVAEPPGYRSRGQADRVDRTLNPALRPRAGQWNGQAPGKDPGQFEESKRLPADATIQKGRINSPVDPNASFDSGPRPTRGPLSPAYDGTPERLRSGADRPGGAGWSGAPRP